MSGAAINSFNEVWLVDFEFSQPDGERPEPVCMVGREWRSGRVIRLWEDELQGLKASPISGGSNTLFVAYYASAELGCYLALRWPGPVRILDLCAEFKCKTSNLPVCCGRSLLGALAYYGLGGVQAAEKDSMRELAMRGGPYTGSERRDLLDYCQSDVDALAKLIAAMLPEIDLPRALLRGRNMAAAAVMEWNGTPIDTPTWSRLKDNWERIRSNLIVQVDRDYGVYDRQTFKMTRFTDYLIREDIPWPRLASGSLALDDKTFKMMAEAHPQLHSLRELRKTLSVLKLTDLAVGSDGRNRCLLSCFGAKTGRNAPSTTKFIFGLPAWLRGLIKPDAGRALAYVDWEQQEFGIAAALSGDEAMIAAYESGDPYLAFAKQAKAVPADATKQSHTRQRDLFKICALAVQYGMGETSLASAIKQTPSHARQLLRLHRETYSTFWKWNDAAVNHAMLWGRLYTVFGWEIHVGPQSNPRSLSNFPMQANGSEMLRLACCLGTEQGIQVCAPVHDAALIEAPVEIVGTDIFRTQEAMAEASRAVLRGFELRTDVKIVRYPDRYMDSRGEAMWNMVMNILSQKCFEARVCQFEPASL
ncbi:MAG: DNA polymerase I [Phycisphaerae bacterium]|nr:DNA polymerase I [Phycisphaerae bacterium]